MKKVFALLLCLALLVAMPVGCKKTDKKAETKTPDELTESVISSDLMDRSDLYYYEACGQFTSMANLKVVDKSESDNVTTVSVTSTAISKYATIDLAATMKYVIKNNRWTVDSVEITSKVLTVTDGPDPARIQDTINNYVSVVGSVFAIRDKTEHTLPTFNVQNAKWEPQWETGAKTAKLNVSYTSDKLTFKGYYNLSLDESGWVIESKKPEGSGQYYPILYLESLEQK